MAKFEKISKYQNVDFDMPQRKTSKAAGYDFVAVEDITIPSYFLQIGTMLANTLTDKTLLEKIEDSEYGKFIQGMAENIGNYDQDDLVLAITKYGPSIIETFSDFFSVDLNEMKRRVKEYNTKLTLIPTGVKAQLADNQVLELSIRSSVPMNNYIMLGNGIGIIDADYYNNPDNEGHIFFQVINLSPYNIKIKKGDIIGQGKISTYDIVEDDNAGGERVGGFGSTNV